MSLLITAIRQFYVGMRACVTLNGGEGLKWFCKSGSAFNRTFGKDASWRPSMLFNVFRMAVLKMALARFCLGANVLAGMVRVDVQWEPKSAGRLGG